MSNRTYDFKNFLSLYIQKRYKFTVPPVIESFYFSCFEDGGYGEEGYVSSGLKTEITVQGSTSRDFWGIDNEDLKDMLEEYFNG